MKAILVLWFVFTGDGAGGMQVVQIPYATMAECEAAKPDARKMKWTSPKNEIYVVPGLGALCLQASSLEHGR